MEVCIEKEEDSNWKLIAGISTLGWCVVGWIASTPAICVHPLNHRGQWVTVNRLQIGSRAEQANNNCYKVNVRYDTTSRRRICEWHLERRQYSIVQELESFMVMECSQHDLKMCSNGLLYACNANYTQALAPCDWAIESQPAVLNIESRLPSYVVLHPPFLKLSLVFQMSVRLRW